MRGAKKTKRRAATQIPMDFNTERFLNKYAKNIHTKCWEWTGAKSLGYGRFNIKGNIFQAHRVSFALFNGNMNPFLVLDHVCMNRACVNPEHLREVTVARNILENSTSPAAKNKAKTHCKNGHDLAGARITKKGYRVCRECVHGWWSEKNPNRRRRESLSCVNGHLYEEVGTNIRTLLSGKISKTCKQCAKIRYVKRRELC